VGGKAPQLRKSGTEALGDCLQDDNHKAAFGFNEQV
jgi:hypothetical protein